MMNSVASSASFGAFWTIAWKPGCAVAVKALAKLKKAIDATL
jgi:hypothetical protein